jgi:hypothetical protein
MANGIVLESKRNRTIRFVNALEQILQRNGPVSLSICRQEDVPLVLGSIFMDVCCDLRM